MGIDPRRIYVAECNLATYRTQLQQQGYKGVHLLRQQLEDVGLSVTQSNVSLLYIDSLQIRLDDYIELLRYFFSRCSQRSVLAVTLVSRPAHERYKSRRKVSYLLQQALVLIRSIGQVQLHNVYTYSRATGTSQMLYFDCLVGSQWPLVTPRYRPIAITGRADNGQLTIRRPFFTEDDKKPYLQSIENTLPFLDGQQQQELWERLEGEETWPLTLGCYDQTDNFPTAMEL